MIPRCSQSAPTVLPQARVTRRCCQGAPPGAAHITRCLRMCVPPGPRGTIPSPVPHSVPYSGVHPLYPLPQVPRKKASATFLLPSRVVANHARPAPAPNHARPTTRDQDTLHDLVASSRSNNPYIVYVYNMYKSNLSAKHYNLIFVWQRI